MIDEVIPQVYTTQSAFYLNELTNQFEIEIHALQDYRIDGDQEVNLLFTVTPYTETTEDNQVVETLLEDLAYTLPAVKVSHSYQILCQLRDVCNNISLRHFI